MVQERGHLETDPGEVMDVFFEDKHYLDRWLRNQGIMEMLERLRATSVNIVVHQIQDANQFKALCILPRNKFSPGVRGQPLEKLNQVGGIVFARLPPSSGSVTARLAGS